MTPEPEYLTPGQVAKLFQVVPATITKWANAGRLQCTRTPRGHRRYPAAQPLIAAKLAQAAKGRQP